MHGKSCLCVRMSVVTVLSNIAYDIRPIHTLETTVQHPDEQDGRKALCVINRKQWVRLYIPCAALIANPVNGACLVLA